jgi:hypothetical protein
MVKLLTQMVFFGENHAFLQFRQIGLIEANRAYLDLENCGLQEVFLSKTNSIPLGNYVLDARASNIDDFWGRYMCFFNSAE